jgi:hypothetical protein
VQVTADEIPIPATHLGQPFYCYAKPLSLTLQAANGSVRTEKIYVACVAAWHQSPFVRINPTRSALVGRTALLNLGSILTLDFHTHATTVVS